MPNHRIALNLLLLSLASLSACTYADLNPSPLNASINPTNESTGSEVPAETGETVSAETKETVPAGDEERLYEKYIRNDELVSSDIAMEASYVFDDRTLLLEDSVENDLERLVFDYYYALTAGDFETLYDLNGENESLRIAMKNEESSFHEGVYMSEYIIHQLTVLPEEDLRQLADSSKEDLLEMIDTYQFDQYAVVQADVGIQYNEAWLDRSPQLEEGRYLRYYLLASTADAPEFKLYEVYWGEYFLTAD